MTERVAVYIDFDNVVISRYDNVHGDGSWRKDMARDHRRSISSKDPIDVKLAEAEVDLGAIIDYAASFGNVAFTRAYADWSVPANAAYKNPLVNRSVDLVQLFPASGTKNGADIRLAVDAVEDLGLHPEVSHLVFVAGDSDYVPLAQRCKRMGRYVVGIGVAGSTSSALVSACNEFIDYGDLPGITPPPPRREAAAAAKTTEATEATGTAQEDDEEAHDQEGRRDDRVAGPGGGHRPARAGRPGGAAEVRRRVGVRRRCEEPDAADEPCVQGEVARLLVLPRVRGVPQRGRGGQARRQRPAHGAAPLTMPVRELSRAQDRAER